MDANGDINALVLIAIVLFGVLHGRRQPVPQHNSVLTGDLYYKEIMATVNANRYLQVARMDKETFILLKDLLMVVGGLQNSMYICAGQKLMILLYVMRGHTNRETAERWQHSGATISAVVHEVNDCLTAMNVLGVANFDLTFAFALYGWEGSAHDSRVVDDAKFKGLPLIPEKYYLGDGGYGLKKHILTPYRGERINIIEFNMNGQGPANKRELFNRRHSSLRNTVERLFGVVKRRFPILQRMSPYSFEFQCDLVQCCFLIHNFVRLNQLYEDEFYDNDVNEPNNVLDDDNDDEDEDGPEMNALKVWRNDIADAMWAQYELQLANL